MMKLLKGNFSGRHLVYTASDAVCKRIKIFVETLLHTQDHMCIYFAFKHFHKDSVVVVYIVAAIGGVGGALVQLVSRAIGKGAVDWSSYPDRSSLIRLRQMRVITQAGRLLY